MSIRRILVLGGGFAGLWSALGAARKLDEIGQGPDAVEVTLVNRDAFHCICRGICGRYGRRGGCRPDRH